jgi:LmbE family N-acetylglucosaminyl deacetylase
MDVGGGEVGVARAGVLIRQLDGPKRLLMIGAHPDDEDTSLLATAARGWGAEAAYLSLNRGEGGQNLIGPELQEGLGLVRTGELVAARRLDGARQFFTRTYDFGFTKTAEEALQKWGGEGVVLEQVVRRVRQFRPHVMVSVFSGTTRDGHGQHQVAGRMARMAFEAAGDPTRFPEHLAEGLEPWTPAKLYRRTWRDPEATTLSVETGLLDPLQGRSLNQVAMASRSQHRSQAMGNAQPLGPRPSNLMLWTHHLDDAVAAEGGVFAGVDTTLAGLAADLPSDVRDQTLALVQAYRTEVSRAQADLSALEPSASAPALARALAMARGVIARLDEVGQATSELARVMGVREGILQEALLSVAGIQMDFRAGDDLVVPGQVLQLEGDLFNGGPFPVQGARVRLERPGDWQVTYGTSDAVDPLSPGAVARWSGEALVGQGVDASVPYFLRAPRDGDRYVWPEDIEYGGLPGNPPVLQARVSMVLDVPGADGDGGVEIEVAREVTYRGVDRALGEVRLPILMVPALSLAPEPAAMTWALSATGPRDISVRVRSEAPGVTEVSVLLEVPEGWSATPAAIPLRFDGEGTERSVTFQVQPTGTPVEGVHQVRVAAIGEGGQRFDRDVRLVDYPHIRRTLLPREATVRVSVFQVRATEGLKVGYIMGSGDEGPTALRQIGVDVEELGADAVSLGDFSRFDAIVLGVRAYETRPDLMAGNSALLEYASAGGTVIVQYNTYSFPAGGFAPYPLSMARPHDRVTDEGAAVTLLAPDAPVFENPNDIGSGDFEGWVQERGLYFLSEWDGRYRPLMSMADPGEDPKTGGLVVAPVGEGLYVYTGLAFFRQFPQGVPGAFRLFANLVSLDRAQWDAWANSNGGRE